MKFILRTFVVALFTVSAAHAASPPQRIVSAGGDITEIIYALGAEDRVVGVDSTSNFPVTAKEKEQIGYIRRVSPEGILSLNPDLVIAAHDMGPPAALDQLRAAGVRIELAPRGDSSAGIADKVRFVGKVLGLPTAADTLALKTETELREVSKRVARLPGKPRVLFVLSAGTGAPLVAGRDSSAEQIIKLAGGENAATGFDGYKPMSQEAILGAAPEFLLMMSSTVERMGGVAEVFALPEFKFTPASQNNRLIEMDGMLLLGFGPRTPSAVVELSSALHK